MAVSVSVNKKSTPQVYGVDFAAYTYISAYRLCRPKPRASRSKGAPNKLWYAQSQSPVYDQFDNCSSKFYALIIREINFFTYSDSVLITPGSSNEFPWISIWPLVKPHADCCVDILNARWLRPVFAESYRRLRVNQVKELVTVRIWNAPDQSLKVALQIRAMCTTPYTFVGLEALSYNKIIFAPALVV